MISSALSIFVCCLAFVELVQLASSTNDLGQSDSKVQRISHDSKVSLKQLYKRLATKGSDLVTQERRKRNCGGGGCGGGSGGGNGGGCGGGGCNGGGGGNGGGCSNGNCNGGSGGGNGGCSGGRCNGGRSSGGSRSSNKADPAGLSLRELLMLLPFLSQPRVPQLAAGSGAGADVAGGALLQLAKVITKREAVDPVAINSPARREQLRNELRRLMAEEAKRMASIVVTAHPMFGNKLAVLTTTVPAPTTTWPRTTPVPASELVDDYDVPVDAVDNANKDKVSPGDICRRDGDCVSGASCQRGAVPGLLKYCVCKLPLLGFDGLCVMPGSAGLPGGR